MARILIADDDAAIRESLCEYLVDRCGLQTIQARDGNEAREKLAAEPFDVAILDLRMPGPNGFVLLAELRRDHPHRPVILFTGSGSKSLPHHVLADDPYVRLVFKPLDDLSIIGHLIRDLLEGAGDPP